MEIESAATRWWLWIAWGESGRMTFTLNQQGHNFQRDFGPPNSKNPDAMPMLDLDLKRGVSSD
jgi:hypothetical protein